MSSESRSDERSGDGRRPYRKRRRAELEAQTRERITEAAMNLHGTVGPARTTIKAVAAAAGVQRATVYRHFPDEQALFAACSAHWYSLNPAPDGEAWAAIGDPDERFRTALDEVYRWYEWAQPMLDKTLRDAPLVPAMAPAVEVFESVFAAYREILVRGRPERGRRRARVAAAIGHALAYPTWRSLAVEQQLGRGEAVRLMAALVAAAPDLTE